MSNKKEPKKEKKLIDILYDQLKKQFAHITRGRFDDDSGSWIDCYRTCELNLEKRYIHHLSFNGAGTVLEDVQVWEENKIWDEENAVQLK